MNPDESPSYEHGHSFLGIDLPDEIFGMVETGYFIRAVRWTAICLIALFIVAGAVWFVSYQRVSTAEETRLAPVRKAEAQVSFLEQHHGTEQEICEARQRLVEAENDAMVGDGNDVDHLLARTCVLNLELKSRLRPY